MTKKTKQVAVRMTPEMHKRLEALAQMEHRTLSGQIMHFILKGVDVQSAPWVRMSAAEMPIHLTADQITALNSQS